MPRHFLPTEIDECIMDCIKERQVDRYTNSETTRKGYCGHEMYGRKNLAYPICKSEEKQVFILHLLSSM